MSLRRCALTMLLAGPSLAAAQQNGFLRGSVRDSASGAPVVGAVVVAYGDGRTTMGRNITNETGRYQVALSGTPVSVRVTRIGFRPREIMVPPGSETLELRLSLIPTLLEEVQVIAAASSCPRRTDAAQIAGLLDQARAALLATIVAREANPASVVRLAYERMLDANGEKTESQTVRSETADRAAVSFNAVQTAIDFAEHGFAGAPGPRRAFYGPDADVLLDDGFARSYCFRIADRDPARPSLIGLGFSPANRRGDRVDIDGALWVDTVARQLSHVQFRYLGLDELSEGFRPGGRISFREVQPGVALIDSWSLRLVGGVDAEAAARANAATSRTFVISEIGGELASAEWPNGRIWTTSLGSLRIDARLHTGAPARGVTLGLAGTDYTATTDADGRAQIWYLVPGTYTLTVADAKLATIGLTIPADLTFSTERDSVTAHKITIPTAEEFAAQVCRASGTVAEESAWVLGRVGTANGAPVPDARWSMARSSGSGWEPLVQSGTAAANGLFTRCRNLRQGETVQVKAWRGRESPAVAVSTLSERLTVIPVRLPTATVARGRGPASTLVGSVRDSSTNAPVTGAFVELAGTNHTAITDSLGSFTIVGVVPGEYTAEVRTPALDSLSAVGRSVFAFTGALAPVRLFLPAGPELTRAMCGPGTKADAGVVVGTTRTSGGEAMPPNLRVVAEWSEDGPNTSDTMPRLNWLRTRADAQGGFRICGVPQEAVLTLRAQLDSGATFAAAPTRIRLEAGASFGFAELSLEAGLKVGAAFSGVVVADSTETAIVGAEVLLPDLNRRVATSQTGTFRINDIPAGTHRVTIRQPGFAPITADVAFGENQTVDHRVVLGRPTTTLATVQVTETANTNPGFEENRKLGLGRFLTRDELDKSPGRKLGEVLGATATINAATASNGTHNWLIGKRMPVRIAPRVAPLANPLRAGAMTDSARAARLACNDLNVARAGGAGVTATTRLGPDCAHDKDDLRESGFYCPESGAEEMQGIRCACYAQVWVDGRLMNKDRPTEPFDLNTLVADDIEGVEWYASASQTPARYSSLNSPCGVMAIWTRRRG